MKEWVPTWAILSKGEVQGWHMTSVGSCLEESLLCLGHLGLEIFVKLA